MDLDLSFFNWDLISNYVVNGFYFSVQLTVVATIGGIIFGTVLALMRLSGKKLLVPRPPVRQRHASIPLVMVILWFFLLVPASSSGGRWAPTTAEYLGQHHLRGVRGGVLQRDHAGGHPVDPARPGLRRPGLGMTYGQNMRLVVLPQAFRNMLPVLLTQTIILFQDTSLVYAIGAYDLLKGFVTAGKIYGRPDRGLPARGRRLLHHLHGPVVAGQAPAGQDRHHSLSAEPERTKT
jgi:glutamate/aspartate transport system permease protein